MRRISDWIDIFKMNKGFYSDYALARYWKIEPTRLHQYRSEKMRIPLIFVIEISHVLNRHVLEILIPLEYFHRARECDKSKLHAEYLDIAKDNIAWEMAVNFSFESWKNRRRKRFRDS